VDKIIKNSVKCKLCEDIIISKSTQVKTYCKCGKTCISGGNEVIIREGSEYEELSTFLLTED
jgi:hypothetical protein